MKRLIIYEDDEDTLIMCKLILASDALEVIGFDRCDDILQHLERFQPDAILLDYLISPNGGASACLEIKAIDNLKHIPVILFSAHNDIEEKAMLAKADCFLRKPFDIAELENIVSTALKQG